jgi:hypothetical protein
MLYTSLHQSTQPPLLLSRTLELSWLWIEIVPTKQVLMPTQLPTDDSYVNLLPRATQRFILQFSTAMSLHLPLCLCLISSPVQDAYLSLAVLCLALLGSQVFSSMLPTALPGSTQFYMALHGSNTAASSIKLSSTPTDTFVIQPVAANQVNRPKESASPVLLRH